MKIYKIDKKIRNKFFFLTVYELFYPAVLGTIFICIIQDSLSRKLFNNSIFSVVALIYLIWYFMLDFYIGFTNFKGIENEYGFRYLFCDIAMIVSAFTAYYGLWLSNFEFLSFISLGAICFFLILLDYFDTIDAKEKYKIPSLYNLTLTTLGLLSIGISLISLTLSNTIFYMVTKDVFIIVLGLGLLYYTFYILSKKSYEI